MKTWRETEQIYKRMSELREQGRNAALALVIKIEGSAYRRSGAQLLIEENSVLTGDVSGGCLEQDVREVGLRVMESGKPELVHYETGADEDVLWGLGMGCEGELDIFVRPCCFSDDDSAIHAVCECTRAPEQYAISTVIDGAASAGGTIVVKQDGTTIGGTGDDALDRAVLSRSAALLAAGNSELHVAGSARVFTAVLRVPPTVVICGADHNAIPLVSIAVTVGFRVIVVDHRAAYLTTERFPSAARLVHGRADDNLDLPVGSDTYVVVKTHVLEHDQAWVARFMDSAAPYIGLQGPCARREKILAGVDESQRGRVYGPVGLDLGTDGSEQIALSIVAEILAVVSGREPCHLRDRGKGIHDG